MFGIKTTDSFSKVLLLAAGLVFALNLIIGNSVSESIALNPNYIIGHWQLWRLLTFPFAAVSAESVLLFAIVFVFIGRRLEEMLNKMLFPVLLFFVSILQGLVLTLVFWNQNIFVGGMEGISIFALSLFTFLKPKEKISLLNYKAVSFSLFLFALWSFVKVYDFYHYHDVSAALSSVAVSVFGISSGFITYLQIKLIQKKMALRSKPKERHISVPQPDEMKFAEIASIGKKLYNLTELPEERYILSDDKQQNEDMLNEILDKITESGKASLSIDEVKFLDEYSNKL